MDWNCPFAEHNSYFHDAIMCKKEKKENVDYRIDTQEFFKIFCPYQRRCACKHKVLNAPVDKAKECYRIKSSK